MTRVNERQRFCWKISVREIHSVIFFKLKILIELQLCRKKVLLTFSQWASVQCLVTVDGNLLTD